MELSIESPEAKLARVSGGYPSYLGSLNDFNFQMLYPLYVEIVGGDMRNLLDFKESSSLSAREEDFITDYEATALPDDAVAISAEAAKWIRFATER
jgi:hypothetical protein